MNKKVKMLSMLVALCMILSPICLTVNNIANAEKSNVDTVEGLEKTEELKSTEGVEPLGEEGELESNEELAESDGLEDENQIELQSAEETPFEFDEETGTITGYKDGNPPADLVIPAEINGVQVKHIGEKAFYYSQYGGTINKQLNSVVLPEGLESLGYMAFQKNNIKGIELPSTLTTLGQRSLAYNKLTTIEFPNNLKSIGKEVFQENEFTEIEIPSRIEEIQEGAFKTNKIENVILHDGLKTIGANAFEDNLIEEIEIPETVVNWPSIERDNSIFRNNGKGTKILYLAKVYNNSGATAKNTFGIVNPASVTIEYKDSNGEEIKPSKTIVGKELKVAEKEGTAWNAPIVAVEGSGKDLVNYDAEFGYKLIEVIDEISENYYQMNREYTFEPEAIEDYITPEAQTVKLDNRENTITFTYTKEGQEPGEDLTKPASIELNFPGGKQVTPLYPGGKQMINAKVLNGKGDEIKGEKVIFESSNPNVLKHSFMDTFTAGEVEEETEVTITAKLESNSKITGSIKVIVTPKTEENVINATINEIKPYLDGQTGYSYNYLLSVGMIHNGESADEIKQKMYIRDNYTSASELAENIMTLVTVGEDPTSYNDKNYVQELVNAQQNNGNFKLGYSSPSDKDLMMSIIALDMANADYNKEAAINLLLTKAKKDGTKYYYDNTGDAREDTIERTSLGLIALSNYQDNPEVMKVIGGIKRYFKSRQYSDGNIEGFKYNGDPQFRASSTASVIQSLMAIGDNPLEEEWIKNNKTMLDGLLQFRTSKGFAATEGGMTDTKATINAFAALTDLKNEKSMYGEVTKGEEQDPDLNKPYSIKIRFEGGKTISEIEEGSELGLIAEVLNEDNQVLKDEKINWEVSDANVLEFKEPNKFIAKKVEEETEVTITAISQTDNTIKASIKINVVPKEQKPIIPVNLDEEIDFLKQCYEAYMTEDSNGNTGSAGLSMLAPGAARLAGMDVENIQKHLYIDEDNKSAYQLSQSIITLIGADLDPRQYEDKGNVRNLVKELVASQQVDGENKGEFVKADSDKNSIEAQARSIIALDMASAKYDEESAVSKLIEIYDKKDGSHTYKGIKTEGIVLVALSNHKDIEGVETKVIEILNYLKTKQNEDGGFDIEKGWEKGKNSPTATGRVIQGLISNRINPLEDEEWIKNGSTMLNAIVRSKTVKDNMKHSGYGKGEEDEYTYYEATYTAFGALMDLKNQKSMFEILRVEVDTDAKPNRVEINKPDKNQIEVGQSLALTAKVYDKDGKALQGQELIWESSNEDILTVKDGNIEAKSAGEATITVKVKDTEIQDSLKIIVIEEVKTLEVNTAIIVIDKNDNYEIKSKLQKVTINKDEHEGGLTAFGALQATTSEYEATNGWVNSIYGISGPEKGGWMFNVNGKIPDVGANQVKLKEGDKVIWFCIYDWEKNNNPQWSELIEEEPEEKLSIKIISNKQSIKVGEELPLVAEVRQGDKVLTDKEVQWLSSNAEIATIDENNNLIARKVGEVTITAALVEDKNINDTIKIEVVEKDKEDLTVEEVIKSLREYYSNKDEFKFRPALGYNYTSDNLEKDLVEIGSKLKTNEEPKSASDHVGNIIGLIAAGKDPYNYNNKNYVETLVKSENKEGKFIIGEYDDCSTTVAFSMLALDMAGANYNTDKAIEALLGYQKDDGSFGGVDETGMVITALAKYRDKSEVQTAINKGLQYLKQEQDENTGGFVVWGGENPYSASAVLQGLIAVGENPLSEKWTKGGKTIIDSLMNFYKDGHFEKESEWSPEPEVDSVTEQAFIALADVYRGKSMFNEIKLNTNKVVKITIDKPEIDKIIEGEIIKLYVTGYDNENNIVPVKEIEWTSSDDKVAEVDSSGRVITKKSGKVTIEAKVKGTETKDSIDLEISEKEFEIEYIGDTEVKNGQQANAKVKLNNLTIETKPATLIVVLYDKNTNKLLNYSIVKKELESNEELELAAGFLVPEIGDYYIKAFLWEDLKLQNIIMHEAKEIKVAN